MPLAGKPPSRPPFSGRSTTKGRTLHAKFYVDPRDLAARVRQKLPPQPAQGFVYAWAVRVEHPELFGKACRLLAGQTSVQGYGLVKLEFEDGTVLNAPRRFIKNTYRPK